MIKCPPTPFPHYILLGICLYHFTIRRLSGSVWMSCVCDKFPQHVKIICFFHSHYTSVISEGALMHHNCKETRWAYAKYCFV